MSRITQVQYEQVASACAELFSAGESVSFAKVYQRIGSRGGQQVVADMIRRWRQDIAQRLLVQREHPALPTSLVQASDDLMARLWQQAQEQAQLLLEQQAQDLAQQQVQWQHKLEEANAYVAQVNRENLEVKALLARAQGKLQARELAFEDLAQRHQVLRGDLAQVQKEHIAARQQVVQLEALMTAEHQRHVEAVEALKVQHADALQQVRLQGEADRRHLLQQTDELRQAHRAQAEQLREQLEGARAALEGLRQQLSIAREEGARWHGRAEVVEQEVASLKEQGAKAQEEAARWQGRAQALQEALELARLELAEARQFREKASPEDSAQAHSQTN